jgi:hypothetical protein
VTIAPWIGIIILLSPAYAPAETRFTLSGTVTDSQGAVLEGATVMIYSGSVRQGYSTFCPTCYTDCGKRTRTDEKGTYAIAGLSPDLYFDVLVVRDGFHPMFLRKVDPARSAPTAVMNERVAVTDPRRVVRGRVVEGDGRPIRGAVVEPFGVLEKAEDGQPRSLYFSVPGLEPMAVSNEHGEFEIARTTPFDAIALQVAARGMAPKIFTPLPTGTRRHELKVSEGGVIRGRLIHQAKPVANAELGLFARQHGWGANLAMIGYPVPEVRIGTDEDGRFAITNVPPGVEWHVYGKMESLASRGGAPIIACTSRGDGQELDLGDIALVLSFVLRGKVSLSDEKSIPPGMRITISSERVKDSQTTLIDASGVFAFSGLGQGDYTISPSVRGYTLASGSEFALTVDRNITDLAIVLKPRSPAGR